MIKLIASDLDGTLLRHGARQLDPALFALIDRLAAQGIRFAAASGRQYTNLRRLFAPVADRIDYICENGSLVVSGGEIIYRKEIDRPMGERLIRGMLALEGCEPLLSGVMCCYIQPKDPSYEPHMRDVVGNDVEVVPDLTAVPEAFLKLAAYFPAGATDADRRAMERITGADMRPVVSGQAWIDLLLHDCNKGTALHALQQHLGVGKAETLSFGDNENDIELLGASGIGCAMRDGNPRLTARADALVDEVPAVLERLLRGEMPA